MYGRNALSKKKSESYLKIGFDKTSEFFAKNVF